MIVGIVRLDIDLESDERWLRLMCERINKRFHMSCRWRDVGTVDGISLFLVALESSAADLRAKVDEISQFLEKSGFGRVVDQELLVDDLDYIIEETVVG